MNVIKGEPFWRERDPRWHFLLWRRRREENLEHGDVGLRGCR